MSTNLRKILFPFSVLYGGITKIRNKMYDKGVLSSQTYEIPLLVVGNLRLGGTGKTPQVAYLVRLLQEKYSIAVLSRGYNRKTSGFVLANNNTTTTEIGDEAYQLYRNYPKLIVAVNESRTEGIHRLLQLEAPPDLIILDDAFQHRKVKAGFNILMTAYDDLYVNDTHLPSGNLRESIEGALRAQILIVSKCPDNLTEAQEFNTAIKLQPSMEQTVFFSKIVYATKIKNENKSLLVKDLQDYDILVVTGIAKPAPLISHLKRLNIKFKHLSYTDHHNFSKNDLKTIEKEYATIKNEKKLILTTEKDYVRIFGSLANLFYLAIETAFINHQKDFDKLILDYVETNTRNSKIS